MKIKWSWNFYGKIESEFGVNLVMLHKWPYRGIPGDPLEGQGWKWE